MSYLVYLLTRTRDNMLAIDWIAAAVDVCIIIVAAYAVGAVVP